MRLLRRQNKQGFFDNSVCRGEGNEVAEPVCSPWGRHAGLPLRCMIGVSHLPKFFHKLVQHGVNLVGCTGGGALIRPEIALMPCAIQPTNDMVVSYLIALPCSLLSLLPHGIFEISAYFLAGLAGGILSTVSISNRMPSI